MHDRRELLAACVASGCVIAHQVGGKAVRDTLFLSNFAVTLLPAMLVAAALAAIAVSILAVRAIARWGPARVVPAAFVVSAVLQVGEWLLARVNPQTAAVVVFLHIAAVGPVLTSGFWSIAGECFDPRTARRIFGRIATAGALGGVIGGLAGERIASVFGVAGALLLLAGLHLVCAWRVRILRPGTGAPPSGTDSGPGWLAGARSVARISYVRRLVAVVILATISAALVDYAFKAQAAAAAGRGADLMRIFSTFYVVVSLLTFFVQVGLSRLFLERVGPGWTTGTLPAAVTAGGLVALVLPGLGSTAAARGLQAVFQNSLFRLGYEVLFAPIPRAVKRGTKTLVDVGAERIGDVLGAGLVALALMAVPNSVNPTLLLLAVSFSLLTLWLAGRLHRGYVQALEENLVLGAAESEDVQADDLNAKATLFRTLGVTTLNPVTGGFPGAGAAPARASAAVPEGATESATRRVDPGAWLKRELRSGDSARVRMLLSQATPTDATLPSIIPLLAWDEVAPAVIATLRRTDPAHLPALVEALVDPAQAFAVRRRIPQVLVAFPDPRSVAGMLEGLVDIRFEVRYRCGRAIRRVVDDHPALAPDPERILEVVRREASVGRRVWGTQRLIDLDDPAEENAIDKVLRERASSSLVHVFTLLSLAYSKDAIRIAFRGLHSDDPMLRGTALEYLESLLPDHVWSSLRGFVDDDRRTTRRPRPPEDVLAELMRSHASMEARLEELRPAVPPDRTPEGNPERPAKREHR